jgi:enoyl-CoA hydratase/carnithine racemase
VPDYSEILYAVDDDGIALVTLNRPDKLNAHTPTMGIELNDAMAEADADDNVRVVVLTGAGRAFCAGADLGEGDAFTRRRELPKPLRTMYPMDVRKPVIAAINGHAVGVGLTYPLQADIRFVAEDAKLGFVFVRRGVIPELAAHAILPRLCGMAKAAELLLSGRIFSGAEAVDYGVATRALPRDDVLPAAMELARDIAHNAAPMSVALSKRLLWENLGIDLDEFRKHEFKLFGWTATQPDALEGPTAFLQKRAPKWTGRVSDMTPPE